MSPTKSVAAWPVAALGDLCEIQLGKMLSPKSRTGSRPRPYLRNANVLWNSFDLSSILEMDFSEEEEAKFILRPGDLLVCEGGEPGRAAVWSGQVSPCFYQKALLRLRPKGNGVDPHFIMFRLWLGALAEEFTRDHAKTTIAHLPELRLRALRIGVPSMTEQARIVSVVSQGMARIGQARAAAKVQLDTAREFGISALDAFFQSQEALRWPQRPLGEILTLRNEVVHPSDGLQGRAVFVGLEHIESHTGRRTGSLEVELEQLTGRKPRFQAGDIVYGYLRPYLNKVWVADCAGLCSVDQYVYKVAEALAIPDFVAAFMRTRSYLRAAPISETPGQLPRIRTDEVARVLIPLPSIQQQSAALLALRGILSESERLLRAAEQQLMEINLFPAALLREAFSGAL